MTGPIEIWLYGSRARGDADGHSDTDVLVVADHEVDVVPMLSRMQYPRINVSRYSWSEMAAMRAYGSLYLHHLAMEGHQVAAQPESSDQVQSLLRDLPPFERAREDLAGFRRAIDEALFSLDNGGWPDFECEVIATVARHAAILGAYCVGEPAFGREKPFWVAAGFLGYSAAEIRDLVDPATAWRKRLTGPHQRSAEAHKWIGRISQFVDDVGSLVDDYQHQLLHHAA